MVIRLLTCGRSVGHISFRLLGNAVEGLGLRITSRTLDRLDSVGYGSKRLIHVVYSVEREPKGLLHHVTEDVPDGEQRDSFFEGGGTSSGFSVLWN